MLRLFYNLYILAIFVNTEEASTNITLECVSRPKCGNVLIDKVDKFDCIAHINADITDMTRYIGLFYMPFIKNDPLCEYSFKIGCKTSPPCYCFEKNVFFWNLTADVTQSEMQIRAELFNDFTLEKITSNTITGPRIIKDPAKESLLLILNKKAVENNDTVLIPNNVDKLPLSLLPPEPEVLSLHYTVEDQILESGREIKLKPEKVNIKIKKCDEELRSYNLNFLYYDADESCNCSSIVWIVLFAIVSVIALGLLILIIIFTPVVDARYQGLIKTFEELKKNHRKLIQDYQDIYAHRDVPEMTNKKLRNDNHDLETTNHYLEKKNNELVLRNHILFLTKWNLELEKRRCIIKRKQELEKRNNEIKKCNQDLEKRIKEMKNMNPNQDHKQWIQDLEKRNEYLKDDNKDLVDGNNELETIIKKLANEMGDPKSEQSVLI
ncbi:uncharacterized protein LOC106055300 isoform X2 [Biomphalaria glabrata]|uniref:Uncharacterized protein LOC106055300 isoform X2 n=1 Tax=Biomphalaria glabrata TaxID=6526 RepID=A0A9W2YV41_BIOGL|nr:uncharacterized protein LOC106055300 isoform X2 [Biomphalaria glabrata]